MNPACKSSLSRLACRACLMSLVAWLAGCATVTTPPQPVATASLAAATVAAGPAAPSATGAETQAQTQQAEASARLRLDPEQDGARSSLWARIRNGYAIPDLDHELVRKWERYYADRPDYVQRMTERGGRYLFHIVEEVEKRDMPLDLALLPFIESAFNPQAQSSARAAGMWQFMPATGKDFDLRQNLFRDDRRDILASTRAALDYLRMLHQMFGDWHLALAAYNWGQGSVQRAVKRNERAGRDTDYLSLRMPEETRNYVPKLQAMKNIVLRPHDFSLTLPPLENHPFFISVPITQDIDVALVTRLSGVTLEQFHQLNPQLNKPVILAAGTPQVLLPYDNANLFVRGLEGHSGPRSTWTAWQAPRTLKPLEAARLVGMSEDELREVNRIPPRMLVKAGSTLLVPRSPQSTANVAESVADRASLALAPEVPPVKTRKVRASGQGESVAALARRVGMKPQALAQLNGVSATARFAPHQIVQVPVLAASSKAPAARTAGAAAGKAKARGQRRDETRTASAKPPKKAVRTAAASPAAKLR